MLLLANNKLSAPLTSIDRVLNSDKTFNYFPNNPWILHV